MEEIKLVELEETKLENQQMQNEWHFLAFSASEASDIKQNIFQKSRNERFFFEI